MDKKTLRKEIQAQLNEITKPIYEHLSYCIANRLYATEEWRKSDTIGITISRLPEVDTYQIIRRAWEENKRVVVPKCYPEWKRMIFRELTRFDELESVYFGLYEPIEEKTVEVEKEDISLMIVPGLAYTQQGYRLGFGGGYFDRFLIDYTGNKISLAFRQQIVEQLPLEDHDIPVSKIITDQEIIHTNG